MSTAASTGTVEFPSIAALRCRGLRYWFAAVGTLAIAIPYLSPLAVLRQHPYIAPTPPLPRLVVPAVAFPTLAPPKLHPQAALPAAPPRGAASTSAGTRGARQVRRRVPIVSDLRSLPSARAKPKAAPADPFANVPTIEDTVGAPPPPSSPLGDAAPAAPPAAVPSAQPGELPANVPTDSDPAIRAAVVAARPSTQAVNSTMASAGAKASRHSSTRSLAATKSAVDGPPTTSGGVTPAPDSDTLSSRDSDQGR